MPSDTPRPRVTPIPPHPSRRSEDGQPRATRVGRLSLSSWSALDARARATLCYAAPLAPALYMLARERRDYRVRLHAAHALAFFLCVALAQMLFFALVVIAGNQIAGTLAQLPVSLLLWALFVMMGLGIVALWLRMLADCWDGRLRSRLFLLPLAMYLERLASVASRWISSATRARRNETSVGAARR